MLWASRDYSFLDRLYLRRGFGKDGNGPGLVQGIVHSADLALGACNGAGGSGIRIDVGHAFCVNDPCYSICLTSMPIR